MSHVPAAPPKLADLLARYLERQADAHALGTAALDEEVTPYEAGPVQALDPNLAWDEARLALTLVVPAVDVRAWKAPPQWSTLVAGHESVVALAFAVGNFPQLVRDFHPLVPSADLAALRPAPGRPTTAPLLVDWVARVGRDAAPAPRLLALGALRLAKQYEAADQFAAANDAVIPADLRPAWENERAALAWHAGRLDEARGYWQRQPDSVPVQFNRGMADLFLGRPADARAALTAVVAALPETSAWHHLGRLYLTLAAAQG